jgi:SAM-dependent methyltransferase
VVIDFGCGIGEALALVAGKVGIVAGIDFSAGMLKQSKKRLERSGFKSVHLTGRRSLWALRRLIQHHLHSFTQPPTFSLSYGNLLRLKALYESCDLALAINSIGPPSVTHAYRMFAQIAASVRHGGVLVAVLPSLDTMDHLYALERRNNVFPSLVGSVDHSTGIYADEGERAKFFTPDEIKQLCDDSGLLVERLEKVRYPWSLMKRSGWGYYPRSPRIWDWYLVARKGSVHAREE